MQLIQKLCDDKKCMKKVEPLSRSKAIEDIISSGSFMEALVLNHYDHHLSGTLEQLDLSLVGEIQIVVRDERLKEVLMIDELSIVETDKVIHTIESDMVKLVDEIECFSMSFDESDKETGSSDRLQPKQADLSCVHALNEPHLHEIHVVPSKHEAGQC
ncbi:hypothetical protein Tco_0150976 [Tanacetum coccineum]